MNKNVIVISLAAVLSVFMACLTLLLVKDVLSVAQCSTAMVVLMAWLSKSPAAMLLERTAVAAVEVAVTPKTP